MLQMRQEISKSPAASLSPLLGLDPSKPGWTEDEYGQVLEHQLSAPFEFFDGFYTPEPSTTPTGRAIQTWWDLFDHPNPPLDLLKRAKRFALDERESSNGLLPDEVADVLLLASILVARDRCGERISPMSDRAVKEAVQQLLERGWLSGVVSYLLERGIT